MEIKVGDVFMLSWNFSNLFEIVKLEKNAAHCRVYVGDTFVGMTLEHKNTLLKMKKLSSLEKELM